jgi:hypothetical protein
MKKVQGVEHTNDGEHARGDFANLSPVSPASCKPKSQSYPVTEVEEADGEAAEDDGKVQPGQERALVRERDLGLDAHRERDPLLGRALQQWLCRHGGGGSAEEQNSASAETRNTL